MSETPLRDARGATGENAEALTAHKATMSALFIVIIQEIESLNRGEFEDLPRFCTRGEGQKETNPPKIRLIIS